jgi:flagellum-specific ATP synthase
MSSLDIDSLIDSIDIDNLIIPFGKITNITATTIMVKGLDVAVGDIVKIESSNNQHSVLGMVATIKGEEFTVVPFSFIEG